MLFRADPDDNIKTFEDYANFCPRGSKQGHLFDPYQPAAEMRQKLDRIKGHLVWLPLDFLCNAEMAEPGLAVNQITEVRFTRHRCGCRAVLTLTRASTPSSYIVHVMSCHRVDWDLLPTQCAGYIHNIHCSPSIYYCVCLQFLFSFVLFCRGDIEPNRWNASTSTKTVNSFSRHRHTEYIASSTPNTTPTTTTTNNNMLLILCNNILLHP